MFQRLASLVKAFFNSLMGRIEDPEMMLEQTYQDLQSNLIQVRQAVAQAIAVEKQQEQSLQKNKDQAATWHNRATMAVQQGNDELARQALQRKQQFAQASSELESSLKAQKDQVTRLRGQLSELESEVQKAYTKKQVLIARDKAAQATTKANEILSKSTADGALNVMDKMEQKVIERESKAAAMAELSNDQLDKKFKTFEGQVDIEAELMALKGNSGAKLIVEQKQPVMVERPETVEIEEAEEIDK